MLCISHFSCNCLNRFSMIERQSCRCIPLYFKNKKKIFFFYTFIFKGKILPLCIEKKEEIRFLVYYIMWLDRFDCNLIIIKTMLRAAFCP